MVELWWYPSQAWRLMTTQDSLVHNHVAGIGLFLWFLAAVLGLWAARAVLFNRPRGWGGACLKVLAVGLSPVLFFAGAAGICMGTHAARTPDSTGRVFGAEVVAVAGPANAPLGMLVTIGGYGSESPAFAEPREVRQDAQMAGPEVAPFLKLFRKRILVHLHGGLGWDFGNTHEIAAALDRFLETEENRPFWQGQSNVVVAHSRGNQVMVQSTVFREPTWRRFGVHPPAGVQPCMRAFTGIDPEIGEIDGLGRTLSLEPAAFPWTVMYQARTWDHTVLRFPPTTRFPQRDISPCGSHTTPFTRWDSAAWQDIRQTVALPAPQP